ncbi:MAG: hypothetical protein ACLP9L_05245, partial [Thermoguttaceae bacterium]
SQPYAVLWVKKSTELVLGLALPDSTTATEFQSAPKGCKYAGLTKYLVIKPEDQVPSDIQYWAREAYENLKSLP